MASTKAIPLEDASVTSNSATGENNGHTSLRRTQLQGGYECFFVKDPPQELQTDCSVCLCLLREPHLMDCECGCNFCRTCIEPIKAEGKPCPLCNSCFTTAIPNRQLERVLNEMHVYCSHKDSGCAWKGELIALPQHLNIEPCTDRLSGCQYAPLKCSHCKENIFRRDIVDHEINKCLQRPFSCDYCHNYESTCDIVTNKHWPVCPLRPLPCPNDCGVYPERQSLEIHLKNDCPGTIIECPFSYAGCETRLARQNMPLHISENLATHMSWQASCQQKQLMDFSGTLNRHEQQLEIFNKSLSSRTDTYEKQVQELQESLSAHKTQMKKYHEMIMRASNDQREISRVQKTVQELTAENKQLKLQVRRINSDKEKLTERVKQSQELSNQLDQRVRTLERENKMMKNQLDQEGQTIADLLKESKSMAKTLQEIKKNQALEQEFGKSLQVQFERQCQANHDFQKDAKGKLLAMKQEMGKIKPDITSLKQNLEQQLEDKVNVIKKETKALKSKVESTCTSANMQRNPRLLIANTQPDPQIERIEGNISEIRSEMRDALKLHIGLIPLEVTMHDFRHHKSSNADCSWFSSPFYTHPRGYKMCLNVDANGFGEGKGTHVSVFIYMMQGEFDSELKWPFRGTITVQLLNQKRAEANPHYTVVKFDQHTLPSIADRVCNGSRAGSGQGMLKYISHTDLQHHHFLVNDTLCFRISKVDFL